VSLYLVSTPIGNREDITLRAKKILFKVDLIACEDTRKTSRLLELLSPSSPRPPLISYYEENEEKRIPFLLEKMREGKEVALVSNAGTPLVSDPGFKLVRACLENGIEVRAIPGPSAVITALVLSGLPPDKFIFLGFLPKKEGKKRKVFESVKGLAATSLSPTVIFYESPFRLRKTLTLMKEIFGDSVLVAIARELTKMHEEIMRGSLSEILASLPSKKIKGEVTVLFHW